MLDALRRGYAQLLTSTTQVALLVFGFAQGSAVGLLACSALAGAIGVVAWQAVTRRARAIGDTPTSRVASAAQGYVELHGRGRQLEGIPIVSPVSGGPCLWYRYTIERRDPDNRWMIEEQSESDGSFVLNDGSGECLVDPEGAEMIVGRKQRWSQGARRYTQWNLVEGDRIYALGQFDTKGSVNPSTAVADDVKQLLAEWKDDRQTMLLRFDADKDGEIDMTEWDTARRSAREQIEREHRGTRAQAELSVLRRPGNGRMFLISDLDPAQLARRYRLWGLFHLMSFFVALGGLAHAAKLV